MSEWTCGGCRASNAGGQAYCEQCGAPRGDLATPTSATAAKCLTCNRPGADARWGGKCERCGRCRGETQGPSLRCAFRAEVWHEGMPGLCGWHSRVRNAPRANEFEEFAAYCARLRAQHYCDRWTHFPASELWDAMRGATTSLRAVPCANADCPHAPPPGRRVALVGVAVLVVAVAVTL